MLITKKNRFFNPFKLSIFINSDKKQTKKCTFIICTEKKVFHEGGGIIFQDGEGQGIYVYYPKLKPLTAKNVENNALAHATLTNNL